MTRAWAAIFVSRRGFDSTAQVAYCYMTLFRAPQVERYRVSLTVVTTAFDSRRMASSSNDKLFVVGTVPHPISSRW
jgi:hypothetical protein